MIICGYQGIGKSSLAKSTMVDHQIHVIDLESGSFWINNTRFSDWYKVYANIAVHLSQQGNIVMLSSHKDVRNYLADMNSGERLATVYPSIQLRDKWISKLAERYSQSNLEKDYKALINAKEMYISNIHDLSTQDKFDHIQIMTIDYDLYKIIDNYIDLCDCYILNHYSLENSYMHTSDAFIALKEYENLLRKQKGE